MMTVSEVAKITNVGAHTIRHYIKLGLLSPKQNPENQYYEFSDKDIRSLRFIIQAKLLGVTLKEIIIIFEHARQGHSPCPEVRKILLKRVEENKRKIEELSALQARIERALVQWETLPDGVPDEQSVCYLIESFAD